jgi:hypothetical protein
MNNFSVNISKLFLYSKLKTDIKLEDYLKLTKKINNRPGEKKSPVGRN